VIVDSVLQQLGQIPGVVGAAVYGRQGELLASRFPSVFDQPLLEQVARSLAQDAYLEEWLQGPAASLDLRFTEGRVLLRPLSGTWLLVLCTSHVNAQLLNLSLTQVVRRLQLEAERPSSPPVSPPPRTDPIAALRDQLKEITRDELGPRAAQALELLSRAASVGALAEAATEVEQLTRLFVNRKKAEELGRRLREAFERPGPA
jgi:predicted regulator of Ras-like GTPase activity (Roadblock/LC7/MglB family)